MLGFWHCRRLMGPPNGGLFHGGRFGSGALFVGGKVLFARLAGPRLMVERFCSPGWRAFRAVEGFRSPGWRGLFLGGKVRVASDSGASFVQRKGSVRSYSFHPWSRIDGERVRGAPRRAPDTPGSRPTKSAALPLPSPPFPRFRSVGIRHPAFPDLIPASLRG